MSSQAMNSDIGKKQPVRAMTCAVIFGCTLLMGCGSSSPYAPVQGKVTLDGKPLADAAVAFTPKQAGGRRALGVTRADGTFVLTTLRSGDGALLGDHHVTITAVDMVRSAKARNMAEEFGSLAADMPTPPRKEVWRAPKKYSDKETSELEFTVESGGNTADFALEKESA
ncbi:MAG: hypothetical protein AAGD11_19610 [Planctomycetota bacterium]